MITKKEFYDYVESFHKMSGDYTEEEIFKICEAHKDLVSEKSWEELVKILGVDKTPNALRVWTYRQEEKNGTVKRRNNTLTEHELETLSENKLSEKLTEKLDELYVEKTKVRDSYNAYRRTLRDEARIDSMKSSLVDAVEKLDTLPKVTFTGNRKANGEREAILCLSDLHIGVECDNYYNSYNSGIAAERLSKLADYVIDYCNLYNVTTLHVLNLGDMIHGIIHVSARLEEELDVTEQIIEASELLSEFMNVIQEAAPLVTYRSVVDNHSRAVADLKQHIEKENFSKLIDWYLKTRLAHTHIKFMNDNIDDGIGMFKLKCGKKIMFAHGHQDSINQSFQNYVGLSREWVDHIILAHYHSAKSKEYQGATVTVNGSICGTEQYAFGKRLFSDPSQTLLIIDDDVETNIKIKLN